MKRNFKKMLVVLLTIAMLLSNMNLQAFAAETEGEEATETVVEQVQEQPSVEEEQADEEPAPAETDTGDKQDQPEDTPSEDQKEDPPAVEENTEPTEQEKENDPVVTDENEEAWAKAVVSSQGTKLDTVTGATVSSDAVREAIAEILEKLR